MTEQPRLDDLARLRAEFDAFRAQVARERRRFPRRALPLALVALLAALIPLATLAANPFTDLIPGSPHNADIDALYTAGITTGCVPHAEYCPTGLVTREQMASFLARTAGLGGNPPVANALTAQTVPDRAISAAKIGGADSTPGQVLVSTGVGAEWRTLPAGPGGASYARTVLVSPIGAPTQNGSALLAALAGITTASATNPWLLKIEPGIYDLGASGLAMKPYVDVEGAGTRVTILTATGGDIGKGTVHAAANAELRFLSVVNTGGAPFAIAIRVGGVGTAETFRLLHVAAQSGGGTYTYGVYIDPSGSARIAESAIAATGSGSIGIALNYNNSRLSVVDSTVGGGYGIAIGAGGAATITTSLIRATATSDGYGVYLNGGVVTLLYSTVEAYQHAVFGNPNAGGGQAFIRASSLTGGVGGNPYGTAIAGTSNLVARVETSRLDGGIGATPDSRCIFSYNEDFAPLQYVNCLP